MLNWFTDFSRHCMRPNQGHEPVSHGRIVFRGIRISSDTNLTVLLEGYWADRSIGNEQLIG
jgi:hypothetical protein